MACRKCGKRSRAVLGGVWGVVKGYCFPTQKKNVVYVNKNPEHNEHYSRNQIAIIIIMQAAAQLDMGVALRSLQRKQ